ncbi:hypothetical protein HN51_047605 [Arachis hypogaea]
MLQLLVLCAGIVANKCTWVDLTAHAAARAYDRAAIKFRSIDADINFNVSDYDEDIKQMSNFKKIEMQRKAALPLRDTKSGNANKMKALCGKEALVKLLRWHFGASLIQIQMKLWTLPLKNQMSNDIGIVADNVQDFGDATTFPAAPEVDTICVFSKNSARCNSQKQHHHPFPSMLSHDLNKTKFESFHGGEALATLTFFSNPLGNLNQSNLLKMGICNQDAIKQLQSMIENVNKQQKITFQNMHQGYPTETLAKFLKARDWNVAKAHKMGTAYAQSNVNKSKK